jgi:putative sigma-54 modulation protein
MEITIESPHIQVPKNLIKEIETKLSNLIRMYHRIVTCQVVLKKEKNDEHKDCCIEAKLLIPKGFLFAAEKTESFETALDKLSENIKRQLHRHKEKLEEVR